MSSNGGSAWRKIQARHDAGEGPWHWTIDDERLAGPDDVASDPRAPLLGAVELDHGHVDAAALARLHACAPWIRSMALIECEVVPSIGAVFDVAWPALASLRVDECDFDDTLASRLCAAALPALRELTWFDPVPVTLFDAPWFGQLEILQLAQVPDDALARLAAAALPSLRVLDCELDPNDPADPRVLAQLADPLRPALVRLHVTGAPPGSIPARPGLTVATR